jgi:hypothetical protein
MTKRSILAVLLLIPAPFAAAQAPPSGQKTLAATMGIYAFPKSGQTADVQSKDEAACYDWAVQNTGTDPFELSKQSEAQQQQAAAAQQQAQQAGKGAGARGAVRGAAAGALIGEIADDDAGKGAAYGAAAGVVAGRHRGRSAQKQASAQVEQQSQAAQQSTAAQMDGFKKAFSACMEGKNYMVKF